jgi:hypothetical protein
MVLSRNQTQGGFIPVAGAAGILFALLHSWFKKNVIISVLGAVVSYSVIILGRLV